MTRSADRTKDYAPIAVPKPDRRSEHSHEKPSATVDEADKHVGATEKQVTPTTPPSPGDDEPKSG